MKTKSTIRRIAIFAASCALGATMSHADGHVKPGFIYVGPIGDHGWTYQHDQGRLAVEAEGFETTYVESVPEGADAERVIRQLASAGFNPIFTTSFGYMDATEKVAKDFPDVMFEHATGYKRAGNLSTYAARFYEGRHVIGKMAGMLTKTNKIGYVGAFPIPEVVRGVNAAILAARQVNPDATIHVKWVFSWFDPGKEADAAKALLNEGIDVIMQHTDSPAPVQTAEERGIWAFGQASDMHHFGPNVHATSIIDDWSEYYVARTKDADSGNWSSIDTWGGFDSGMVKMGEYNSRLDPKIVQAARKAEQDIKSGRVHAFTGPIYSRDGELKIKEGETASDELLLGMDFFVEGVVGDLPN